MQALESAYWVRSDGTVNAFASNVAKPNGVMLSCDGGALYVGGSNGLFRFAVDKGTGAVIDAAGTRILDSAIPSADGMARDLLCNIYVAGMCITLRCV